ncbi:hypothetical protein GURASL_10840 [Geotalea uraniireducens]|uniref:HTH arsR-type domain-containing protein n=1 Tax=Geotalea uraniireducens TaxID=351604 RepID=A0ABM8EI74_9BACT|nr:metalloregulator ArsR/SmtB family transcription factor [Geotalea uraniireducens]BDV42161.1 hypothetical protein GURASL_10840 [Geotalea uraniireducens]
MNPEQGIAIMKALADQSRLAIVKSLLERSQYVEELARRHALAPSTVSFHLRKLEQAGLIRSRKEQYYVIVEANEAIFDTTLREIVAALPGGDELQDGRMAEYRRKVLESFFRHGRLEKLPTQQKKRLIVLEQFARNFEPGRRYSEAEVTGLIMPLFDDYCTIRRLLVDEGMIRRDGSAYWRESASGDRAEPAALPPQRQKGAAAMGKESKRTEIKRVYKQNRPEMGIYQLRNRANGKIFVESSPNLEGTRNSRLFQLRMGTAVFNRELQEDVRRDGADSFEFSVLEVLEKPAAGEDPERLLAALELQWLEKLQPFDERGYNNARKYQRDRERLRTRNGEN